MKISSIFVSGINCDCHISENRYNPDSSQTVSRDNDYRYYSFIDSHSIYGYLIQDDLLIGKKYLRSHNFYMISEDDIGNDLKADGFLGLNLALNIELNLIYHLYSKGMINERKFSVYLSDPKKTKKQSALTVGYWDPLEYAQSIKQDMFKIIDGYITWTVRAKLYFDGYYYTYENITFDMSSSSIKLGYLNYDIFIGKLTNSANCKNYTMENQETYLICNCNSSFPSIKYSDGIGAFTLYKEDYLRKEINGLCRVLIQKNHFSDINDIIGLPFFKAFYTMFDMTKREIHFMPTRKYELNFNDDSALVYQGGMAAILIIGVAIGVHYIRKSGKIDEMSYQKIF